MDDQEEKEMWEAFFKESESGCGFTPPVITDQIKKVFASITSEEPRFIEWKPDYVGCKRHACYANARRKAKELGGSVQYGWLISNHDDLMLSINHHAVVRQADGSLVDFTPLALKDSSEEHSVLFAPDDTDGSKNMEKNYFYAISNDPLVLQTVKKYRELEATGRQGQCNERFGEIAYERFDRANQRIKSRQEIMRQRKLKRMRQVERRCGTASQKCGVR